MQRTLLSRVRIPLLGPSDSETAHYRASRSHLATFLADYFETLEKVEQSRAMRSAFAPSVFQFDRFCNSVSTHPSQLPIVLTQQMFKQSALAQRSAAPQSHRLLVMEDDRSFIDRKLQYCSIA